MEVVRASMQAHDVSHAVERMAVPCVDVSTPLRRAWKRWNLVVSTRHAGERNRHAMYVVEKCVPTLQIQTTVQNRSIPTRRTVRHEGNPDEDERMANGTMGRRQPKERDRTDGDVTKRTRGSRRRAFPRETPDHAETCLHRPRGQTRKDTQRSFLHPPTEPRRITLATPRVVR